MMPPWSILVGFGIPTGVRPGREGPDAKMLPMPPRTPPKSEPRIWRARVWEAMRWMSWRMDRDMSLNASLTDREPVAADSKNPPRAYSAE